MRQISEFNDEKIYRILFIFRQLFTDDDVSTSLCLYSHLCFNPDVHVPDFQIFFYNPCFGCLPLKY